MDIKENLSYFLSPIRRSRLSTVCFVTLVIRSELAPLPSCWLIDAACVGLEHFPKTSNGKRIAEGGGGGRISLCIPLAVACLRKAVAMNQLSPSKLLLN